MNKSNRQPLRGSFPNLRGSFLNSRESFPNSRGNQATDLVDRLILEIPKASETCNPSVLLTQNSGMSPVSGYILLKLASRCNLNCSYCYWFRDKSVYETPALMTTEVVHRFLSLLERHIIRHNLPTFRCIYHGGEPLLFGVHRFADLVERINVIGSRTGCKMEHSITTNGVLINDSWADLFKRQDVRVAVSIDGPIEVHDRRRPKISGRGSHEQAVRGYSLLCKFGLAPAIIAVCDPLSDPEAVLSHFVDELGARYCDILVPDLNYDDNVESVSAYYIKLFDVWYDKYSEFGVDVRFLSGLVRGILGLEPNSDSFGYAPVHTVSLCTNGALEPLDVLRIAGYRSTQTATNVFNSDIDDVRTEPAWKHAYEASLRLCSKCEACRYRNACGGGHLSQRWSKANGYDNPSVYCADFERILDHVKNRVLSDLTILEDGREMSRDQVRLVFA